MRPVLHKDIINKYAGEYKFDPLLIMALVKVESNFASKARSHRGAIGLMQLLPSTAEEMAQDLNMKAFTHDDLERPEINILLGYHYLARLRKETNNNIIEMLAAYNAGKQNMLLWKANKPALAIADIKFRETRDFVHRVLRTYMVLKKFQKMKLRIEHA
jgi:soluble lytic murein transglycosylase